MSYFDFIAIGVLLVAFYGGYKNGLIKTILGRLDTLQVVYWD